MDLTNFTEKSQRAILKSFGMTEQCAYKFLEPQILMAYLATSACGQT